MNKKSGHWQNTGLAKWISDNLYQYNTSDEKSMNPMKWYSIQNGGNLNDTRETINGFPCRLILINDGETPLNEGQNEPTPGNVKDMGIFNFNNDKGNTDTFGLDNKIFPQCVSYEVVANSDTSAGAFVPYGKSNEILIQTLDNKSIYFTVYIPKDTFFPNGGSATISSDITIVQADFYDSDFKWKNYRPLNSTSITVPFTNYDYIMVRFDAGMPQTFTLNGKTLKTKYIGTPPSDIHNIYEAYDENEELAYLQDSFELRYPDDKEVGADYGMLGMDIDNSGTLNSEYGLKRVIDWVGNATNEEFVANFEQYFNKEYTFRYYLLVIALG